MKLKILLTLFFIPLLISDKLTTVQAFKLEEYKDNSELPKQNFLSFSLFASLIFYRDDTSLGNGVATSADFLEKNADPLYVPGIKVESAPFAFLPRFKFLAVAASNNLSLYDSLLSNKDTYNEDLNNSYANEHNAYTAISLALLYGNDVWRASLSIDQEILTIERRVRGRWNTASLSYDPLPFTSYADTETLLYNQEIFPWLYKRRTISSYFQYRFIRLSYAIEKWNKTTFFNLIQGNNSYNVMSEADYLFHRFGITLEKKIPLSKEWEWNLEVPLSAAFVNLDNGLLESNDMRAFSFAVFSSLAYNIYFSEQSKFTVGFSLLYKIETLFLNKKNSYVILKKDLIYADDGNGNQSTVSEGERLALRFINTISFFQPSIFVQITF